MKYEQDRYEIRWHAERCTGSRSVEIWRLKGLETFGRNARYPLETEE